MYIVLLIRTLAFEYTKALNQGFMIDTEGNVGHYIEQTNGGGLIAGGSLGFNVGIQNGLVDDQAGKGWNMGLEAAIYADLGGIEINMNPELDNPTAQFSELFKGGNIGIPGTGPGLQLGIYFERSEVFVEEIGNIGDFFSNLNEHLDLFEGSE
jgi:hypothetical protein